MRLNPISKKMAFLSFTRCGRRRDKEIQPRIYMEENEERCLKCGKQEGLQGVAVTIGRRTFHLFYLCPKCGNVDVAELLKIIRWYKEKRKT
jgi:predicted nucleic-acid-binding Zn-ribbon protein